MPDDTDADADDLQIDFIATCSPQVASQLRGAKARLHAMFAQA